MNGWWTKASHSFLVVEEGRQVYRWVGEWVGLSIHKETKKVL
jgi:hypothetical protein